MSKTHTVKKDETIDSIAEAYGMNWADLLEINGMSNYDGGPLKEGQELKLSADAKLPNKSENGTGTAIERLKNYGTFGMDDFSESEQYKTIYDKLKDYPDFKYDVNGDALYQQYKDKYIKQGKLAMQDTIGQASAMTGGYGNSYAQSAGQQAYQASLDNLNDVIPELYQLAYDQHNTEKNDLYNQLALLTDMYERERTSFNEGYDRLKAEADIAIANGEYDSPYLDAMGNPISVKTIKELQANAGVSTTGVWDDATKAAYGGKSVAEVLSLYYGGNIVVEPLVVTPPKVDITTELNTLIKQGATKSEIGSYLRAAKQDGYITQEEYNKLKEQYTPIGNTY